MRFGLRLVLFCLMAIIITAPAGYAQASAINGEVTGTVTDPSGAAISGATVTITSGATGFKQSTKTAESGLYRFALLPLGTYDIEVTASGFADTRHTGIVVNAGAIKSEDVQMQLSATSTRIEVAATAVITDPSRVDRAALSHTTPSPTCRWCRGTRTTSSSSSPTLADAPTPNSACRAN